MAEKSNPKAESKNEPDAEPNKEAESVYQHWTREHLHAETEARRISMREGAEPHEYRTALLADDDAKAKEAAFNKANDPANNPPA